MLLERLGKELLYFDGGMGTLLQSKGLQPGELPEVWNLEHAEEIIDIHKAYFEAGSDIVLSNPECKKGCRTWCARRKKDLCSIRCRPNR